MEYTPPLAKSREPRKFLDFPEQLSSFENMNEWIESEEMVISQATCFRLIFWSHITFYNRTAPPIATTSAIAIFTRLLLYRDQAMNIIMNESTGHVVECFCWPIPFEIYITHSFGR